MCFMMSCVLDTTPFFLFASAARLTTHTLQQNTSHCTEGWSEQQQVHSKVLAKPVSKACQQRTTSVSKEQLGTPRQSAKSSTKPWNPHARQQRTTSGINKTLEPARLSLKIKRRPWNPHACQQRSAGRRHQTLEPARLSAKNSKHQTQSLGTRTPVNKEQQCEASKTLKPAGGIAICEVRGTQKLPKTFQTRTPASN